MAIGGAEGVDASGNAKIIAARITRKDHSVPRKGRHRNGIPVGRIAQSCFPCRLARGSIERENMRVPVASKQLAVEIGDSTVDAEPALAGPAGCTSTSRRSVDASTAYVVVVGREVEHRPAPSEGRFGRRWFHRCHKLQAGRRVFTFAGVISLRGEKRVALRSPL